ncbi:MAG: ribulose-phosphate 3-epimerase [Candidatus Geothermincolia bacterium]
MGRKELAPSILNADFSDLRNAVAIVEGTADCLHLDVMDGRFVPNLTFGPLLVEALNRITDLPLDVHLMIEEPERYVPDFIEAGADWVSFHLEASRCPRDLLRRIKAAGCRPGLAISPATDAGELTPFMDDMDFALVMTVVPGFGGQSLIPECLAKIAALKKAAAASGRQLQVEVDGGVNTENLRDVLDAGADILVVGSSIYSHPQPRHAALAIRSLLDS